MLSWIGLRQEATEQDKLLVGDNLREFQDLYEIRVFSYVFPDPQHVLNGELGSTNGQ